MSDLNGRSTPIDVENDPPSGRRLRLFIIAGENSGDIHGSNLIKALRKLYPNFDARGLGGPNLEKAGVVLQRNIVKDLAIIGFVAVLANIRKIRRLFYATVDHLREWQPDALILVDYPGFNIRIAEKAKQLGIPVIWYISPQIWAWHKSRLYTLAKLVDKMLVVFPFEVGLYREENVDVEHVGHPLFDLIKVERSREEIFEEFGLDPSRPLITLVPGSRKKEVTQFLSIMLEGTRRYREQDPTAQFVIVRASTIDPEMIDAIVAKMDLEDPPVVVDRLRYHVREYSDFSWVKSGTSTLEAAILGRPMLIVYRVNYSTWTIGKHLFTIGHIGLPNIVAGDRIVPELLQDEFTAQNLADKTYYYMTDREAYERMEADLLRVKNKLGGPGASKNAARAVLEVCGVEPDEEQSPQSHREHREVDAPRP
ncbi:MAG: lipid-A-disaccharide synthase [Sumerlaeia bacterium]